MMSCLTTNPLFNQLVLDANVLDIAMRYREDILVMEHPRNNENFHYSAYRKFVLWQHGRLGRSNRVVVPSCCVLAIRQGIHLQMGYIQASGQLDFDENIVDSGVNSLIF